MPLFDYFAAPSDRAAAQIIAMVEQAAQA